MKNFKVTGWNKDGSYQAIYVCAENSAKALEVGKAHGIVNKTNVKKSNVSGGFTA